jgi:hypothetical protein
MRKNPSSNASSNADAQEQAGATADEAQATPQVTEDGNTVVVEAAGAKVTVEVEPEATATARAPRSTAPKFKILKPEELEALGTDEKVAYIEAFTAWDAERKAKQNGGYKQYRDKLIADPERKAKYDAGKRAASQRFQAKKKAEREELERLRALVAKTQQAS